MFKKKSSADSDTNFWISYADLMAGLLFIFILLIGAIVVKSMVLKNSLDSTSNSLDTKINMLFMRDSEIQKLKKLLAERMKDIQNSENALMITRDALKLKTDEIVNLNNILLAHNMKIDDFNNKIIIMQNLLNESKAKDSEQNKKLQDFESKVLILSNTLTNKEDTLKLKDEKLIDLLKILEEKETDYDKLIAKLKAQKAQIKNLTGIRIKVIAELKSALGKKVKIDPSSGSLQLDSSILFAKNEVILQESSKVALKKLYIEYMTALMSNRNIKDQIDRVVIEGHTDSDGGYLLNLNISQQRAYAVMSYLASLDYTSKNNLKPLLEASGRSYTDRIMINGREDKDASRRIAIKFTLKNDSAMNEIERILDYE